MSQFSSFLQQSLLSSFQQVLTQDGALFSKIIWLKWLNEGVWRLRSAFLPILKHWLNDYCGLLTESASLLLCLRAITAIIMGMKISPEFGSSLSLSLIINAFRDVIAGSSSPSFSVAEPLKSSSLRETWSAIWRIRFPTTLFTPSLRARFIAWKFPSNNFAALITFRAPPPS